MQTLSLQEDDDDLNSKYNTLNTDKISTSTSWGHKVTIMSAQVHSGKLRLFMKKSEDNDWWFFDISDHVAG